MGQKSSSRPKVVDLFAGAGLLSHAFQRQGLIFTLAVESRLKGRGNVSAQSRGPCGLRRRRRAPSARGLRRAGRRAAVPRLFHAREA